MLKRTRISVAIGAAFGIGLVSQAPIATAQQQLDRVEVTGSSIKRIEGETALPVQVITREDIQRTGASNVEQLMQTVSAAASSQNIVAASASGATTLGLSGISLRGLSSLRTLVLINGKRVTPYGYGFTNDASSVDVNSIPLSAIERVEVLKDGASAVYGSDAIAGVVNFILRKDFVGLELGAEYGTPTESSAGSNYRVWGTYGFGDLSKDRFNVMVTAAYQKEKALFGRDRSFASSGINVDANNDTTSGNTFPANIAAADGSFGTRNPSFPTCPLPYATRSPLYDSIGSRGCRFDPSPLVSLTPEVERVGVFASGRFKVTPDIEAYGEASFAKNEARTRIQPTPISDQFTIPLNNPLANVFPYNAFTGGEPTVGGLPYSTILLSPTSPFYPTAFVAGQTGGATPDLLVRWRSSALGDRDFTDTSEASRLNFGARGVVGGWDYDAGFLYTKSNVVESINDGYALYTRIMPLLNSGTINFFGPQSAAGQAALNATKFFGDALETETSMQSLYGKLSRDIAQLKAGPVALALGGEIRKEKYEMTPSSALITGDLTGYGGNFANVDVSRDVYGLFGEVNIPVITGLETNLALRYDDYENVGNKTTGKIGVRYQPNRSFLLRGAYGTGFRAPSLLDLYAPATTGVTPAGLNDPLRCDATGSVTDCGTQFPITNGGNPNLKPETSKNFTAGIVLEPTTQVSVALDYFNIEVKETISNGVPAATILSDPVKYGSLISRGAPAGGLPGPIFDIDQTNINLGETKLSGWDLDVKWGIPSGYGKFTVGLNGTYYLKYDVQNPDGSFTSAIDNANNATGGLIPRWKHYAFLNWGFGAWSTTFAQNYQGDYKDLPGTFEDPTDPAFTPRTVDRYVTYDFQTVYSGFKNLTVALGVRNLTDEDPPYTNSGGQVVFQGGYDPTYADPRGRFVYARATYKFF
jgi:iron complex outermembrane receptor protein